MKGIDNKSVNNLFKRLEKILRPPGSPDNNDADEEEDEAIIQHRFACYRMARAKKTAPALLVDSGNGFTYEDVYNTITQEELDWSLKQQLKVSPEERYQDKKKHWYSHESSYLHQTVDKNTGKAVDIIKEYGCGRSYNNGVTGGGVCVPECRYYSPIGRIEDSEVIQKHREREKRYRDNNAIVEPPELLPSSTS